MRFEDYRRYDGLGLAGLIAARQVSTAEVLEAALTRADAVGASINAIVTRMDAIARERAASNLTGPFAGTPFVVKDLAQEYAGVACSYGSRGLKTIAYTPDHHAEITARWLDAGVVILGRTNTPEFGMQVTTEPAAWGPSRNPWDLARTPAGSSGGSAAAVAAGVVPLAGANDLGGSIRVPASVCGLFGFKPGRGRTPWGPERGEMMLGAAVNHVISRSVRDSAAMLDATIGPELGSPFIVAPPERPYFEEVTRQGPRLSIGFSLRSPLGLDIDPEARLAVETAAKLLQSLGHTVEEAEPEFDGESMIRDLGEMLFVAAASMTAEVIKRAGPAARDFELDTRLLARLGRALRADELAASIDRWQDYILAINRYHQRWPVFMTPMTAGPPPKIGATATPKALSWVGIIAAHIGLARPLIHSPQLENFVRAKIAWAPFGPLANLTGAPAMSVPLHWTAAGLPMGVQFIARAGGEGMLFRLAGELERAQPWFDRTPPL